MPGNFLQGAGDLFFGGRQGAGHFGRPQAQPGRLLCGVISPFLLGGAGNGTFWWIAL
jgi:hypothetical protein